MWHLNLFKVCFTALIKISLMLNIPEFDSVKLAVGQRVVKSLPFASTYKIIFPRGVPKYFT